MGVTRQRFKDLARKLTGNTFKDFTAEIDIERQVTASDGQGGFTKTWARYKTIKESLLSHPKQKAEAVKTDGGVTRIESRPMVLFSFEYVAGITNDMRINAGGVIYNIKDVASTQGRDIWITITAELGEPT